jgi:hypothetical protein
MRMNRHVTVIAIQFGMFDHTRPVRRQALRIINSTTHITRRARVLTGRNHYRHDISQRHSTLLIRVEI